MTARASRWILPSSCLSLTALWALGACAPAAPGADAAAPDGGVEASVTTEGGAPEGDAAGPTNDAGGRAITIRFDAVVGAERFACGRTYPGVGTMRSTWTPKDFRFYVHDVRLVTADGDVPVTLDAVGGFQGAGVALLDFEDRGGACTEGTTETRTEVTGRAAGATGMIRGLKFKVGVPFELNHREPSSAPAPLNLSALWWTWNGGYKFMKIDGATMGLPMGFNIHVGSTGCMGNNAGPMNPCAAPNVAEVTLDGFDPARDVVTADLGALVSMSNLEQNAPMTPPGCMSTATDADCGPIFGALGLAVGGGPARAQRFFRVMAR
jgi:uncharacterized repeat protein (TIGR04052 family)